MQSKFLAVVLTAVVFAAPAFSLAAPVAAPLPGTAAESAMVFEENLGQADPMTRFVVRGAGQSMDLRATGNDLHLTSVARDGKGKSGTRIARLSTRLVGASADATGTAFEPQPGYSNYLQGRDPAKWLSHVAQYGRVRFESVYPGVDLVYYGKGRQLEYDFIVAPGASPAPIRLGFEGLKHVALDHDGNLVLTTRDGVLVQHAPLAYQIIDGARIAVAAAFRLDATRRQAWFEVASYDSSRPLVIDPVLSYESYLGGPGTDQSSSIAVDASGRPVLVGSTTSSFPSSGGAYRTTAAGNGDVFITKLSADGSQVLWSTYLGGSGQDQAVAVALDSSGAVYVTGTTTSGDFPLKTPQQATPGGLTDAFVTKLSADGSKLLYSTYLGGDSDETVGGLAIDSSGQAYVVGATHGSFPVKGAFQATAGGDWDGWIAKLDASGSGLLWASFLGDTSYDALVGVAIDASGNPLVVGNHDVISSSYDRIGFAAKIASDGSAVLWRNNLFDAYIIDTPRAVAIAGDGHDGFALLAQGDNSQDGGNPNVIYDSQDSGVIVVTHIDTSGAYQWQTEVGGPGFEQGRAVALDRYGNVAVVGYSTGSSTTVNATQSTYGGGAQDGFVAKIRSDGQQQLWATYLGGAGTDDLFGVATDANGNVLVSGFADAGLPVVHALQATSAGGTDAVFAKFSETTPPPTLDLSANPTTLLLGGSVTLTWNSTLAASCASSGWYADPAPLSGSFAVKPQTIGRYDYSMSCSNSAGVTYKTVSVQVNGPPSITLYLSPQRVNPNQTSALSWYVDAATSCVASGTWSGARDPSSGYLSVSQSVIGSYPYTLRCSNSYGTTESTATLTVANLPKPTVTIAVSPTQVVGGQNATLTWSETDADSCVESGNWAYMPMSGSMVVETQMPQESNSYLTYSWTLTCTGDGGTATGTATLKVTRPPPTLTLTATPNPVNVGYSTTLNWSTTDARDCTASGAWSGYQNPSGSQAYAMVQGGTFPFTLTCTGDAGSVSQTASVRVKAPPPGLLLTMSPASITQGQRATLTWSTSYASSCTASGSWSGTQATSGSIDIAPTTPGSYTYSLKCDGSDGTITQTAKLTVAPAPAPTLTLTLSSSTIYLYGTPPTLSWSSTGANACTASDSWSGAQQTAGSTNVTQGATGTYTYSLSCSGYGGGIARSVTLTILPAPTLNFSVSPYSVYPDGTAKLSWTTTNTRSCAASGAWSGTQPLSGSDSVMPGVVGTYTYTLTCDGLGAGPIVRSTTLRVDPYPLPSINLSISPTTINTLQTASITWFTSNATSCTASGDWLTPGSKAVNGSETVLANLLKPTRTYTLTCTGKGGSASRSATLNTTAL